MAFIDKIFGFFGPFEKRQDSNKDNSGRGTLERYMRAFGDDLDTNVIPLIENLSPNLYEPEKMLTPLLDYQEDVRGVLPLFNLKLTASPTDAAKNEWMRRRILRSIDWLRAIKGTKKCYQLLLYLIDPTIVAVATPEYFRDYRYDNNEIYDDIAQYDMSMCSECPQYDILITTTTPSATPTTDFIQSLKNIITFNHPIDCRIRTVRYNSTIINL